MKAIQQSVTTEFFGIELNDAIAMLPLMDRLCSEFKDSKDRLDKYSNEENQYRKNDAVKAYLALGHQLKVLLRLGFCPSPGNEPQFDIQYFPESAEL